MKIKVMVCIGILLIIISSSSANHQRIKSLNRRNCSLIIKTIHTMISHHHQAKNFPIFMWKKLGKQIPPQRLQLPKYYLSGWCRAPAISRRWDRRHIRMFAKTLITVFAGFFLCSRESLSQVVFPDASGATAAPAISTVANFFGITNPYPANQAYPAYPASPFIQTSKCLEVATCEEYRMKFL